MLIERPSKKQSLPTALAAVRLLIAVVALSAPMSESKPVFIGEQLPLVEQADPLMALPSGQRQQVVYVEQSQQQQQQQPQEVHYVYSSAGQQQATVVDGGEPSSSVEHQYQPTESVVGGQPEQIQYVSQQHPEAPYQLIQDQAEPAGAQQQQQHQLHSYDGINCNKRHEYTSLMGQAAPSVPGESNGEYPGEILYIGQDRDLSSDMAGSLAQNSGLPATILTEIPVNEMPVDVLEKLKKDYGVKVVATRERPGANLVINCDDYANQDNSICQRQQNHHHHHNHHHHDHHDQHDQQQQHQQAQQVFHNQPLEHPTQPQASPYVYSLEDHQQEPQLEQVHNQRRHHYRRQQKQQQQQQQEPHVARQHRYRSSDHEEQPHHLSLVGQHPQPAEAALEKSHGEQAGNPYEAQPATNYSVEPPESHHVEYVPTEAQAEAQPSSAPNSEANAHEAYGSRTTVSADEQPESAGAPQAPQQSAQTESVPLGQQEATPNNGDGESSIGSPDTDPRHAGFDEQPPKVAEEQERHSKQSPNESTTYVDQQ